jgi:hypothetical protein
MGEEYMLASSEKAGAKHRNTMRKSADEKRTALESITTIVDQRPESIAQRRMRAIIHRNAVSRRIEQLQKMMGENSNYRAKWAADRMMKNSVSYDAMQAKRVSTSFVGTFNANEVRAMLDSSQGRNGSTGATGHVREHVKNNLATEAYARDARKTKSCFKTNGQQNQAVKNALNTSYGQGQLQQFDATQPATRVVIANAATGGVSGWVSEWNETKGRAGRAKNCNITKMTVVVDRLAGLTRPELHVQTAYPVKG